MSRLNDLVRQVGLANPSLAADLQREVAALADRRSFGLNFERHVPETVELPGRPVRKGDKVRILPPRGQTRTGEEDELWRVMAIDRAQSESLALLVSLTDDSAKAGAPLGDLIVVAEFRDPIYPGLVSTGKVEHGGDKPFHTVINAENYHALEALLFTHRGKVDCIYIDPPYNTGAKDWKYNNDYVEGDDLYRHSKWLAFMERRLLLAQGLLNPNHSVLIATIDEKEVHHLGMLLEQLFPAAVRQMVSIVINPLGQARKQELARVDEYAFFVFLGDAAPTPLADDLLTERTPSSKADAVRWERLLRGGTNARRIDRPNLFYPVFIDAVARRIVEVGDTIPVDHHRSTVPERDGLVTVWPLNTNGNEGRWRVSADSLRPMVEAGYAKVGAYDSKNDRYSILYLGQSQVARIATGEVRITGRDDNNVAIVESDVEQDRTVIAKTVWYRLSHRAGEHGSSLLKRILPGRDFPFPKSLYAVRDTLQIAVGNNPDAVILDFFAGSGTTAHATMLLNASDGGRRRTISVTNNEIPLEGQARLRSQGFRPGDPEWEEHGICDSITRPRITAAVTGLTPAGAPIEGVYKFTDEFPMADGLEENTEFFTLTYESPLRVASNRDFERIAPLLWLRAGARGRRIEDVSRGWDVAEAYGVLADLDKVEDFIRSVATKEGLSLAFIVTDEDRLFQSIVRDLPEGAEPVRLYEAYLRNFEIEAGRGLR